MDRPRRIALGISIGLLILLAWQNGYLKWVPVVGPSGPVDHVVVICESGDRTPEQAVVILGKTARELRDTGKWRLWDDDEIPEDIEADMTALIAGLDLPVVILFHDGKPSAPVPLPKSDEALAALMKEHGGY